MNNWIIENGTLLLKLRDGSLYRPQSVDLYTQKNKEFFEYAGHKYAPLSQTALRFSDLTAHPKLIITYGDVIKLHLVVTRAGKEYQVALYNQSFNDYILVDTTWRAVDSSVEKINEIVSCIGVDPLNVSYSQYIQLSRLLSEYGLDCTDNVVSAVNDIKDAKTIDQPKGLEANLFPYQAGGSQWLNFMVEHECGSVLGDEMGLGKTLQIIAVMGYLKEREPDSHFLVVCPVSLLENWKREIWKFYPSLTVNIHYGARRTGDYRELMKYDVNIMSYSCTMTDAGLLTMLHWDLLVIDEAQNIKNPNAKRTLAVKRIKCKVPIAVTGTPFENHMTDIWSIMDFAMPNFLGSLKEFEKHYTDDVNSALRLEKIITPLMLRRRVADVAQDLPERIDIPQPIMMTEQEARLYEDCRSSEDNSFEELKEMRIDKIQKLRTFCTHPYVYNEEHLNDDPISISNKYERLCDILSEIFENREKVVIFTSFRRMIELLCSDIKKRFSVYTNFIDGGVEGTTRQSIVDDFASVEGAGVLVLNPKAAGAGLNITCANHAIHYNLEWNPAVEDQASARIYRRGQGKTVFIHRLFYVDTIEEIINEKIQSKRLLSETAIVGNVGITDHDYLIKALSVSPYKC